MAEKRAYEIMYVANPETKPEELEKINSEIETIVEGAGSTIVKSEDMGLRKLAYRIGQHTQGFYYLFEIEGAGTEIAEIERRLRVADKVIRYLSVRVDEERKTAAKIESKLLAQKERVTAFKARKQDEFRAKEDSQKRAREEATS